VKVLDDLWQDIGQKPNSLFLENTAYCKAINDLLKVFQDTIYAKKETTLDLLKESLKKLHTCTYAADAEIQALQSYVQEEALQLMTGCERFSTDPTVFWPTIQKAFDKIAQLQLSRFGTDGLMQTLRSIHDHGLKNSCLDAAMKLMDGVCNT
jgi:hypothetical protein